MDDENQPILVRVIIQEEWFNLNWLRLMKSWYDNLEGKMSKFPTVQVKSLSEEL